jgi:hypothetical protein
MPQIHFSELTDKRLRDLAAALTDAAGRQQVPLEICSDSQSGFSMHVDDIQVTAIHSPNSKLGGNTVYFFIDLGRISAADELAAWRALMEVNFELLNARAACFSRRPVTGEVLLQKAWSLEQGDVGGLLGELLTMVGLARRWSREGLLAETLMGEAA